jgi:hypothetical protein
MDIQRPVVVTPSDVNFQGPGSWPFISEQSPANLYSSGQMLTSKSCQAPVIGQHNAHLHRFITLATDVNTLITIIAQSTDCNLATRCMAPHSASTQDAMRHEEVFESRNLKITEFKKVTPVLRETMHPTHLGQRPRDVDKFWVL